MDVFTLPLGPADVDITDTTTGVPVWVLLVAIIVSASGGFLGSWVTRRRDRASSEQQLIDQLQEQVRVLTSRVTLLEGEVRNGRIREIGWITYTGDLTRAIVTAGGDPPPIPAELRTVPATPAPATA